MAVFPSADGIFFSFLVFVYFSLSCSLSLFFLSLCILPASFVRLFIQAHRYILLSLSLIIEIVSDNHSPHTYLPPSSHAAPSARMARTRHRSIRCMAAASRAWRSSRPRSIDSDVLKAAEERSALSAPRHIRVNFRLLYATHVAAVFPVIHFA